MKTNPGVTNSALLAWDGTAATPRDVSNYTQWAFVLEVTATLAADAIFEIAEYDAQAADRCAANLATKSTITDIPICTPVATPAPDSRIIIPSGTVAGTVVSVTTHCNAGPFVALDHISGGADVLGVLLLTGRRH